MYKPWRHIRVSAPPCHDCLSDDASCLTIPARCWARQTTWRAWLLALRSSPAWPSFGWPSSPSCPQPTTTATTGAASPYKIGAAAANADGICTHTEIPILWQSAQYIQHVHHHRGLCMSRLGQIGLDLHRRSCTSDLQVHESPKVDVCRPTLHRRSNNYGGGGFNVWISPSDFFFFTVCRPAVSLGVVAAKPPVLLCF
jgi:hypothetical protein